MRRIPRPQRAIDSLLPVPPLLRQQTPLTYLRRVSPCSQLRSTSACFSTTPTFSFLLSGKQDKKRHQQFVRRWQKRLLGDSEPIGAHVDPYDPTSPVRIAPEEQGEEVEVLSEEHVSLAGKMLYEQTDDGRNLRHVGGKQWTEQLEEVNLAKEFEKLTMRTYTPMSLQMADQIEDLTGTPYTLRDENLMMAQTFHEFTGKPYTHWGFGRRTRVRDLASLRENFHRAVVEIYALKEAGKNLDLSASANRGIYDTPNWLKNVKLSKTSNGDFALAFPQEHTLDTLIEEIHSVPQWSPEEEYAVDEELVVEEGEDAMAAQAEVPTMDPDTPPARRAALVKQDPDKKPFDFMSNRPAPRAKPAELIVKAVQTPKETVTSEPQETSNPRATAADATGSVVSEQIHAAPEPVTQPAKKDTVAQQQTSDQMTKPVTRVSTSEPEAKWREVPLTDIAIKFALTKRLNQLTGLYISDPHLNSVDSLGDLYHYFCAAAKPETKNLHSYIHVEGERQNFKANQLAQAPPKQKAQLGTLLKLGNVEIHRRRPSARELRKRIGLQKVVNKELQERRLQRRPTWSVRRSGKEIIEGTRVAPEFGVPLSPNVTETLKQRTLRRRKELEEEMNPLVVDQLVRESNLPPRNRVSL